MLDAEVTSILEEAAATARATYISPGLSQVCRDFVQEAFKHKVEYRRDVLVADLVEFLQEQAAERFIRGGVQVRLAEDQAMARSAPSRKRKSRKGLPKEKPAL